MLFQGAPVHVTHYPLSATSLLNFWFVCMTVNVQNQLNSDIWDLLRSNGGMQSLQ